MGDHSPSAEQRQVWNFDSGKHLLNLYNIYFCKSLEGSEDKGPLNEVPY